MVPKITMFAVATLLPLPLLALGAFVGGWWVVAALLYLTAFTFLLDELIRAVADPAEPDQEFPAANRLSATLAISHFFLLVLAVWTLSSSATLGLAEKIGLFFAFGLFFGQVSNSNAHELIHRSDARLRGLGRWVYITLLFGHHTSAHPHIHHRYVGTEDDPNTARLGESFYRFARRAWIGSFRAGYEIESALRQKRRAAGQGGLWHPYAGYILGALVTLGLAGLIGGVWGVIVLIVLAAHAQMQLLLSDYVQHYGLVRHPLPDGRLEPVNIHHSWNTPHWFSSYLMLNAPRHSDHHTHPTRPYPALRMPSDLVAPILPYSLPVMGALALYPRRWKKRMDPMVAEWRDYGARFVAKAGA